MLNRLIFIWTLSASLIRLEYSILHMLFCHVAVIVCKFSHSHTYFQTICCNSVVLKMDSNLVALAFVLESRFAIYIDIMTFVCWCIFLMNGNISSLAYIWKFRWKNCLTPKSCSLLKIETAFSWTLQFFAISSFHSCRYFKYLRTPRDNS